MKTQIALLIHGNSYTPLFTTEKHYLNSVFLLTPSHSSLNKVTLCTELAHQLEISSFPFGLQQHSSVPQQVRDMNAAFTKPAVLTYIKCCGYMIKININPDWSFLVQKYAVLRQACVFMT